MCSIRQCDFTSEASGYRCTGLVHLGSERISAHFFLFYSCFFYLEAAFEELFALFHAALLEQLLRLLERTPHAVPVPGNRRAQARLHTRGFLAIATTAAAAATTPGIGFGSRCAWTRAPGSRAIGQRCWALRGSARLAVDADAADSAAAAAGATDAHGVETC